MKFLPDLGNPPTPAAPLLQPSVTWGVSTTPVLEGSGPGGKQKVLRHKLNGVVAANSAIQIRP